MSFFRKLFKPKARQLIEQKETPTSAPIAFQAVSSPPLPAAPASPVVVTAPTPTTSPVSLTQQVAAQRASRWQNVCVFISGTLNDMHVERDTLVKQVFPRLQEWCERRELRRWISTCAGA